MKCPVDGSELLMSERNGIEIDYCPQCRGVWLDRGELDKIIERAAEHEAAERNRYEQSYPQKRKNDDYYEGRYYDDDDRRSYDPHNKRRRKSFFDDMFDIFD